MRAPFASLLACGTALIAIQALLVLAYLTNPGVPFFNLERTGTLWTWLSSLQLAAIGVAFLVAHRAERLTARRALRPIPHEKAQLGWGWIPLALVFFALSADEVVSVHERLAYAVVRRLPPSFPMHDILPWQIVLVLPLVFVLAALLVLAYSRLAASRPLMGLGCAGLALLTVALVVDGGLKAYLPGRVGVVTKEWAQLMAETCLLLAFAGYAALASSREVVTRRVRPRTIGVMAVAFLALMVVPPLAARVLAPAYFYRHMAENCESYGNDERAVWAYDRALETDGDNPRLWHALGLAALRAQNYERAAQAFGRETELQPRDARAHSFVGIVAFLRGDLDGAQAAYERALAIKPTFPRAHRNLAWVHERRGDDAAAEREYRLALATNDGMADVHRSLGDLLSRTGRGAEAIEHWRRSLELDPEQTGATVLAERIAE